MKKSLRINAKTATAIAESYGYAPVEHRVCHSSHLMLTFKSSGGAVVKIVVSSNSAVAPSKIKQDFRKAHLQNN